MTFPCCNKASSRGARARYAAPGPDQHASAEEAEPAERFWRPPGGAGAVAVVMMMWTPVAERIFRFQSVCCCRRPACGPSGPAAPSRFYGKIMTKLQRRDDDSPLLFASASYYSARRSGSRWPCAGFRVEIPKGDVPPWPERAFAGALGCPWCRSGSESGAFACARLIRRRDDIGISQECQSGGRV